MLTSFFSTSKPVNMLVVIGYMTVLFWIAQLEALRHGFEWLFFLRLCVYYAVYVLTMLVFNFIAQRNELTKRTTYKIFFFATFTAALPAAFEKGTILIAGLFFMLALRRLMSVRSGKVLTSKLFDAGFWMAIACLFYVWSLPFILLCVFALVFYSVDAVRLWFLPLLGFSCVVLFVYCYIIFTGQAISDLLPPVLYSFNFKAYSELRLLIPAAFFASLYIWCIPSYIRHMKNSTLSLRPSFNFVIFFSFVSLVPIVIAAEKSGVALYFFLTPLAIMAASYIETSEDVIFRELLLWAALLLPLVIVFL